MIIWHEDALPELEELVALYGSVGWTAYTNDPAQLVRGVAGSPYRVAAREDGRLLGFARAIGDGATIAYVQDVVVDPAHQRRGIGRGLLTRLLDRLDVRQVVLLTDDEAGQHAFYRSCGLVRADEIETGPLRAFVRLR